MGLIIHLCGSVNAKKIVVVVSVARLVLEVLAIAGVTSGRGCGGGRSAPPAMQVQTALSPTG